MTADNAGQVIDLADPHRAAVELEPVAPRASLTVLLFDPAHPAVPRKELAANYDPSIHVRWEARAAVVPIKLDTLPFLSPDDVELLTVAGLDNLKSILGAGTSGLQKAGLQKAVAEDYMKWATSRQAASYALAEIAAEEPAAEPVGEEDADPEVTPSVATVKAASPPDTTLGAKPSAPGKEVVPSQVSVQPAAPSVAVAPKDSTESSPAAARVAG